MPSDVSSRISRINIVCLRDDAIYSFECFIFHFMKVSSAVNYLYEHTDDSSVEALLFAVKWLITAVCVYPVVKCGEKSYTTVIV